MPRTRQTGLKCPDTSDPALEPEESPEVRKAGLRRLTLLGLPNYRVILGVDNEGPGM